MTVKKNYIYKLMTRESLNFARSCEIYGEYTRQQALEILENVLDSVVTETDRLPYKITMIIQVVFSILPFFVILLYCQRGG